MQAQIKACNNLATICFADFIYRWYEGLKLSFNARQTKYKDIGLKYIDIKLMQCIVGRLDLTRLPVRRVYVQYASAIGKANID